MLKRFMAAVSTTIALACSTQAPANTIELNPKRTVEVIDVIGFGQLSVAQQIDSLTATDHSPLYLMINSPGGAVLIGGSIIDSMYVAKSRGVKIICAAGTLAASMAFNILAHCDERYALKNTKLLFHPARIMSRDALTAKMLSEAATDLLRFEKRNKAELIEKMSVDTDWFNYHYERETMWEAAELSREAPGFITIVSEIKGTDKQFVIERKKDFLDILFGGELDSPNYKLIHIMPGTVKEIQQ